MGFRDRGEENPFMTRRLGQIFQGKSTGNPYTQGIQEATSGLFKFDPTEMTPTLDTKPKPAPTSANNPMGAFDPGMLGSGQASTAYRDYLKTMPTREENQPGIMGRIGAALAGGAAGWRDPMEGIKVGSTLHNMKYANAMQDYATRGAGLKEAADLENQDVDNKMKYINDFRARANDERNTNSLIAQREAEIEDLKNKNWRETYSPTGELILVHPDGREKNFGKTDKSTEMGFREREVKANESRAETYKTKPAGGMSFSFVSPEQQFQSEAMAGMQVRQEHPEWAGWIKADGTLKPTDGWGFSYGAGGEDAYKAMLAEIKKKKQGIMGTGRSRSGMGTVNFNDLPE